MWVAALPLPPKETMKALLPVSEASPALLLPVPHSLLLPVPHSLLLPVSEAPHALPVAEAHKLNAVRSPLPFHPREPVVHLLDSNLLAEQRLPPLAPTFLQTTRAAASRGLAHPFLKEKERAWQAVLQQLALVLAAAGTRASVLENPALSPWPAPPPVPLSAPQTPPLPPPAVPLRIVRLTPVVPLLILRLTPVVRAQPLQHAKAWVLQETIHLGNTALFCRNPASTLFPHPYRPFSENMHCVR
jgi:hypothetical protein